MYSHMGLRKKLNNVLVLPRKKNILKNQKNFDLQKLL